MTRISPIGRASGRSSNSTAGFTLVELLIVLAAISVLMSISAPSMKSFSEARRLKAAAESIRHLCFFARDAAETEGEAFAVVFDLSSQRYWLAREAALDVGDLALTVGIGAFGELEDGSSSASNDTELRASRLVGVLGQVRQMTRRGTIQRIDIDRDGQVTQTDTGYQYILFGSQGSAEPASVYLTDENGHGVVVDVPLNAAHVEVRSLGEDELNQLGLDLGGRG